MTNLIDDLRQQVITLKLANNFGNLPAWVLTDFMDAIEQPLAELCRIDSAAFGRNSSTDVIVKLWYQQTGRELKVAETIATKEQFKYLDNLRASGVTNMFGAVPYLLMEFRGLTKVQAKAILLQWMREFNDEQR